MPFASVSAKDDIKDAPSNMTGHKDKPVATSFVLRVTGADKGSVWGSDNYTLDSRIAAAAVHAGAVKVGETAVVVITLAPGLDKYTGSTRNGVKTSNWGSYAKSYQVKRRDATPVTAKNLMKMANAAPIGTKWKIEVTGKNSGSVWGTDDYTLDSSLAKAAIHAGVLKEGETKTVTVTVAPGLSAYKGTERNGVKTSDWGSYAKSYKISK